MKRWTTAEGLRYEYEPEAYVLNVDGKLTTYRPDIRVAPTVFIEVKGWMRPLARKKIEVFIKQYGNRIILVGQSDFGFSDPKITYVPIDDLSKLRGALNTLCPELFGLMDINLTGGSSLRLVREGKCAPSRQGQPTRKAMLRPLQAPPQQPNVEGTMAQPEEREHAS